MSYEDKIYLDQLISTTHNNITDMEITLNRYAKVKQNALLKNGVKDAGIQVASDEIYMNREKIINQFKEVLDYLKKDYEQKYKIPKV